MKKFRKIFAIILSFLFLITITFSYVYIVRHVHHDCTGRTCPICMELEIAEQTVSIMESFSLLPILMVLFLLFTDLCVKKLQSKDTKNTLITLKVELLI